LTPRTAQALAGAAAALVWAALEPLDRRLFRCEYSDVALLGKAVTRGPAWPLVGLAAHATNGAVFGLVLGGRRGALPAALAEHVGLWPLTRLVDRYHPARGEPGIPRLAGNRRAFAQATFRHAVFGLVLGRLTRPADGVTAS
jgi:hypothetical protein